MVVFIAPKCEFVFDFKVFGVVKSKVCLQKKAFNATEAAAECKRQGGRLYRMESKDAIESITTNAEPLFRGGSSGRVWVDGMNPPECQMIDFVKGAFVPTPDICESTYWSFCEEVV
jgi:hypothetical protein